MINKKIYNKEEYEADKEFRTIYYYKGPKKYLPNWLMQIAADAIDEMVDDRQEDIRAPKEEHYEQQEEHTTPHNSNENIQDTHIRSAINTVRWGDAELGLYPHNRVFELLSRYEDKIIEVANYYTK